MLLVVLQLLVSCRQRGSTKNDWIRQRASVFFLVSRVWNCSRELQDLCVRRKEVVAHDVYYYYIKIYDGTMTLNASSTNDSKDDL